VNSHQIVRRLRAFQLGTPLARGETLHFSIADDADLLIIAFIRMGGESAPWAVGFGQPGREPTILSVPEPRNRDLVAGMAAEFVPALLTHLRHPEHSRDVITGPEHTLPVRQVWLPNSTHLDMLHYLAYAYTFTKWGDPARALMLNKLGRATNWLFQEAHRPGQVTTMVATEVLRESFAFPAQDVRQGHLGYLLAWLRTDGAREERMRAAEAAEQVTIATSLDPALERDTLDRAVEQWNDARRAGDTRGEARPSRTIGSALKPEVAHRWRLTEQAIRLLRSDGRRVNSGAARLEAASREEHWYRYLRIERRINDDTDGPAYVPSPETDRYAAPAAARFFTHEESEEVRYGALIHDDTELQADAIADGEALRGTIVRVRDDNPHGRAQTPVWTIESPDTGPLRLRESSRVCPVGLPQREGHIRSIEPLPNGGRRLEVEITGWKRARRVPGLGAIPAACDDALRGTSVVMVKTTGERLARTRGRRVWERGVPGGWLTHGTPTGPGADLPPEVADDMTAVVRAAG